MLDNISLIIYGPSVWFKQNRLQFRFFLVTLEMGSEYGHCYLQHSHCIKVTIVWHSQTQANMLDIYRFWNLQIPGMFCISIHNVHTPCFSHIQVVLATISLVSVVPLDRDVQRDRINLSYSCQQPQCNSLRKCSNSMTLKESSKHVKHDYNLLILTDKDPYMSHKFQISIKRNISRF